jgi:hypothetical protein
MHPRPPASVVREVDRFEVSADIACRQIQGTQAGNLKVRKILAYASPLPKDLFGGRADVVTPESKRKSLWIRSVRSRRPSRSGRLE